MLCACDCSWYTVRLEYLVSWVGFWSCSVVLVLVCVCCIGVLPFLFCFVLFCFVLFCFVLFCFVLFCFVLFCFVLFCFVLFCFVLCGIVILVLLVGLWMCLTLIAT